MSWIWLCHLFNDGRFATSHEGDKRIRWTEDYAMFVKEKNKRQKEVWYVCIKSSRIACSVYLKMIFLLSHEALAEEKKKDEDKSKGIRKNVLKARLIIRNLSFQVRWATWESKAKGGQHT